MSVPLEPYFKLTALMNEIIDLLGRSELQQRGMLAQELRAFFIGERPKPPCIAQEFDEVLAAVCQRKLVEPIMTVSPGHEHRGYKCVHYRLTVDGWIIAQQRKVATARQEGRAISGTRPGPAADACRRDGADALGGSTDALD